MKLRKFYLVSLFLIIFNSANILANEVIRCEIVLNKGELTLLPGSIEFFLNKKGDGGMAKYETVPGITTYEYPFSLYNMSIHGYEKTVLSPDFSKSAKKKITDQITILINGKLEKGKNFTGYASVVKGHALKNNVNTVASVVLDTIPVKVSW